MDLPLERTWGREIGDTSLSLKCSDLWTRCIYQHMIKLILSSLPKFWSSDLILGFDNDFDWFLFSNETNEMIIIEKIDKFSNFSHNLLLHIMKFRFGFGSVRLEFGNSQSQTCCTRYSICLSIQSKYDVTRVKTSGPSKKQGTTPQDVIPTSSPLTAKGPSESPWHTPWVATVPMVQSISCYNVCVWLKGNCSLQVW